MSDVTENNRRGKIFRKLMETDSGCLHDVTVGAMALSYEPLGTRLLSVVGDGSATLPRPNTGGN